MKYRFTVPLEEPRGKSYMKSYHVCFSRKLARKISALGQLQFDNLLCLEMDHRVLWYCERPLKQKYHVDGRGITVCPSVYVVYADGTDAFQLVISKPDESKAVDEFSLWGVSANEHIEILGHKDVLTTLDIYTDATKDFKKKEMLSFEEFINKKNTEL